MAIHAVIDERRNPSSEDTVCVYVWPVMLEEVYGRSERVDDDDCQLFILPRNMASWDWPATTMQLAMNWAERLWYPVVVEIWRDRSREEYFEYEKELYLAGGTIDCAERYYMD
jgi:hypothetical protein